MVEVGRKLLFADSPIPPMLFDPAPDIAGIARSLGVEAYTVVDPRELEATLEAAFARALPTVVDVRIDAEASPPIGSRTNTLLAEYSGRSRAAARGEQ